jgi:hypothetical protein
VNSSRRFWLVVSVRFLYPVKDVESDCTAPGYYITFGVTASSEAAARTLVERAVTDGEILWDDSAVSKLEDIELDPQILGKANTLQGDGVWYASGRILYPDET